MKNVCIVTDSSIQFPKPNFVGRELIHVIPFDVYFDGKIISNDETMRAKQLPKIASDSENPHLVPPDPDRIREVFSQLSSQYEMVFAVFLSREITGFYKNAFQAIESLQGKSHIQLIDSKTTSAGLGLIIQRLLDAILAGDDINQIERRLRKMIPRIYTLICTPSLSYLHYNHFIEKPQSIISEMLGIIPIFTLEEGKLSPIEKVKSQRHALMYFQEFIEEFDEIEHIAYIQSAKPNFKDAKNFNDSVLSVFPATAFSKHLINLPLSVLFGPRSNCLIVLEKSPGL